MIRSAAVRRKIGARGPFLLAAGVEGTVLVDTAIGVDDARAEVLLVEDPERESGSVMSYRVAIGRSTSKTVAAPGAANVHTQLLVSPQIADALSTWVYGWEIVNDTLA